MNRDRQDRVRFGVALQGVDAPHEFVRLVTEIEEWGFDQLWLTDSSLHARDVYSYLTLAATATRRLSLGTSVTNPVSRHPALAALAIATVDEISGGRAILGIGAGDRPLESLGLRPANLATLREAIRDIRGLLTGEHLTVSTNAFSMDGAHIRVPTRPDIPIYLSASGPKALALTGELADGAIVLAGLFPEGINYALSHIRAGAAHAGRSEPNVTAFMYGSLRNDPEVAIQEARPIAAWFCQTAPRYCRLAGMPEEVCEQVRAAYDGGEFQEAAQAAELIPDEIVRKVALAGTSDDGRQKVQMLIDSGVHSVVVFPLGADRRAVVETFAREVMPFFATRQTGSPD